MSDGRDRARERPGQARPTAPPEEPPPFLRTWPRVYAAVLGWLGLMVLLMHLFTLRTR